jgi:hypothetical protein
MKEAIAIALLALFSLICGITLGAGAAADTNTYRLGVATEKAIKDCEATLPRNQKCVIVGYEFKTEEIK